MPHFDIVKKSDVKKTYRVARIMSDYDVRLDHAQEHFVGDIQLPEEWEIGVIVGSSGSGKTTIAKEVFGDQIINGFGWSATSVIDDMPKECSMEQIEKMFYSVGFGSVPSWLKPFDVLSNGEKMRVELARALLEKEFVVFDEFTSVVDRNVAQTACLAINKAVRKSQKKFVAVTCHYDVLEWLQPDWVFDTNQNKCFFQEARDRAKASAFENAGKMSGKSFAVITI